MRACHIFCHTHIDCLRRFFHVRAVEHRHLLTICAAICAKWRVCSPHVFKKILRTFLPLQLTYLLTLQLLVGTVRWNAAPSREA